MIQITTDSCADLNQQLLDAHGLRVIPLHVLVDGEDYLDNDLTLNQLFESVEKTGELPKTAAPSVEEFSAFFNTDEPVIYVGLSSQLSATMGNAKLAQDEINKQNLHLIDSLNLSTGIGLLALKAADLRDEGKTESEITAQIETARAKVKTSFVIDTMDYLYKGGRCSGLQAFVGSMLQIHPIIFVREDGSLGVLDKVRGSRKKALDKLLKRFKDDLPNVDLKRVFLTHTGCDADAEYLTEKLNSIAKIENIHVTYAGATIGSHCGPGTIGILYLNK